MTKAKSELSTLPPRSIEVERAVIGASLIEKEGRAIATSLLSAEVFYDDKNAIIFKSIKDLISRKEAVDLLTVTQDLKKKKLLDAVGGAYEITLLTNAVSSSANTEYHCRILLQLFFKRQLIAIGRESIDMGFDEFLDVFDSIDKVKKRLKDVESYVNSNGIVDNNAVIDSVIEAAKKAKNGSGLIGYSTGLISLDNVTGGLLPGLKYVIAALPSVGKSALARTICLNMAYKQDAPGVFFSMEMPREQVVRNCISDILSLPSDVLKKGQFSASDESRMLSLKNTLFTKNFIIDDRPALDPREIRATLRKLKESHGIKWFCVDYLGLMKLKGSEHRTKLEEAIVAEITAENKNMAKEFGLICIELAQFTKETQKRTDFRPRIGDLKGSGAIEANADVAILIYRPEHHGIKVYNGMSSAGFTELIIAKNRDGVLKSLLVKFAGEFNRFENHEAGTELEITTKETYNGPEF